MASDLHPAHTRLLLLLPLLLPSSSAAPSLSSVRWYVSSGRVDANVAFARARPGALTGFYGCCGSFSVAADGSVKTRGNLSDIAARHKHALDSKVLSYHAVFSVDPKAILSGAGEKAAPVLALAAKEGGADGLLCDYEPDFNYTDAHAEQYASFLLALRKELNLKGLTLGMDVAGWGLLDKFDIYGDSADFYTSMSPTYNAQNLTKNKEFVRAMERTLGAERVSVGIGSTPQPGYEKYCSNMPSYNYTNETLTSFLSFLKITAQVSGVDIWRCDIDHYGKTADFFVSALEQYLKPSNITPCSGHRCDTDACPCGCECGTDQDPGLCYVPADRENRDEIPTDDDQSKAG